MFSLRLQGAVCPLITAFAILLGGCGGGGGGGEGTGGQSPSSGSPGSASSTSSSSSSGQGTSGTGNSTASSGTCELPEKWAIPTSSTLVGSGSAASCTFSALTKAVAAGGYITFSCGNSPVVIPVTAPLSVAKDSVIDGAGKVTLDGGSKNRILVVESGKSLSVRNLRFINGAAAEVNETEGIGGAVAGKWRARVEVIGSTFENNTAGRGGGAVAVWTGGKLVISESVFNGNKSWYGGAVYSLLSPLTVVNSVFTNNYTVTSGGLGDGGALGTDGASEYIDDANGGDVLICGTRIANNKGYGNGGGAYLWVYPPDRVIIDRTTVESNEVGANSGSNNGLGGAMRISNGEISVRRSSFVSNTSNSHGGALYLDGCNPTCLITNSTFYKNSASKYGGAIFGDRHEINNVTFANNSAGSHGGAIFGTSFVMNNTVLLDNSAGNPWGQAMSCSSTGSGAHVVQWLSASSTGGADKCVSEIKVSNPLLLGLADNGGPAWTMLPAATSPLLQAGSGCEAIDQRGVARNSMACDIGAAELP